MTMSADVEKYEDDLSEDDLVEIVRAKRDKESVRGALREVSRRRSPRRLEVYRAVLDDPEQDARAKRTVVAELGTEQLPESQELLLQHLDARDAPLFAKVVQSLGQIGDEQALERLEQIGRPGSVTAIRALEFAKSLVAYRLRLDRNLIRPPSDAELVEVIDGIPFTAVRAAEKMVKEALEDTKRSLPAVALAEQGAVLLTCGSNELLLVFTDELRQPGSPETIQDRSALPVVLLRKGLSLERYFLEQYFFTHPSEGRGEVALLGIRPRGELTYGGKIQVSEDGFIFTLRSVDSHYVAAIEVEGRYDPAKQSLEFTKAIASTMVAARERTAGTPRRVSPSFE